MIYAIIENEVVENVIVADEDFIEQYYPNAICVDNITPTPSRGCLYKNGEFIKNDTAIPNIEE